MTYPNNIDHFVTKIDKNASGWYVSGENFNIPSSPYTLYLDHVPKDSATTTILPSGGGAAWTEDLTGSPSAGEYYIDYDVGSTTFNSADTGTALEAQYYTLGDDIMAEHINSLQISASGIEIELGLGVKGSWQDLSERLDNIDSEFSLNASQVSCVSPVGTSQTDVQDHIDSIAGTADDDNPHGITWNSIFNTDGSIDNATYDATIKGLNVETISASGNFVGINVYGPDADQYVYFYDSGVPIGSQWIKWNDGDSRFELSTDVFVHGSISASGNIMPDASGTRDIGSVVLAWDEAYIDKVYLEGNPTTGFQATTKNYVDDQDAAADSHITSDGTSHSNVVLNDAHRLNNSQAHSDYLINTGDTIAGNLDPEASGTRDLGTVALAFNDAHIDKVYLEGDPTTGLEAATKNYVDAQIAAVIALIP